MCFTVDKSKPLTAPGPAVPEEQWMETMLTATGCWVSRMRLMLHIRQTKEIGNLIVSHSLVQPNISKSDSLSLSQSKTLYNQISLNLLHYLWSGKVPQSLSILLNGIFICHFKSNLVSLWFSKHLVSSPHSIPHALFTTTYLLFWPWSAAQRNELFLLKGRVNNPQCHMSSAHRCPLFFQTHFFPITRWQRSESCRPWKVMWASVNLNKEKSVNCISSTLVNLLNNCWHSH